MVTNPGVSLYKVEVPIDFGFNSGVEETTVIVTQMYSYVTSVSKITCQVVAGSSGDHDPEDAISEGLIARAINIVPGLSFDVMCKAPEGTWGRYVVNCVIS